MHKYKIANRAAIIAGTLHVLGCRAIVCHTVTLHLYVYVQEN